MSGRINPAQRLAALRWWLLRAWQRTGAAELLLVTLLVSWGALSLWVTSPLAALRDETIAELRHAEARGHAQASRADLSGARSRAALEGLLTILPPAQSRERLLKAVGGTAARNGLAWTGSEYLADAATDLPVTRTTLRLTVRGQYPGLRSFVRDLLADIPNLAITQLAIEGGAGDSGLPTLTLESRLYFRNADSAPVPEPNRIAGQGTP